MMFSAAIYTGSLKIREISWGHSIFLGRLGSFTGPRVTKSAMKRPPMLKEWRCTFSIARYAHKHSLICQEWSNMLITRHVYKYWQVEFCNCSETHDMFMDFISDAEVKFNQLVCMPSCIPCIPLTLPFNSFPSNLVKGNLLRLKLLIWYSVISKPFLHTRILHILITTESFPKKKAPESFTAARGISPPDWSFQRDANEGGKSSRDRAPLATCPSQAEWFCLRLWGRWFSVFARVLPSLATLHPNLKGVRGRMAWMLGSMIRAFDTRTQKRSSWPPLALSKSV